MAQAIIYSQFHKSYQQMTREEKICTLPYYGPVSSADFKAQISVHTTPGQHDTGLMITLDREQQIGIFNHSSKIRLLYMRHLQLKIKGDFLIEINRELCPENCYAELISGYVRETIKTDDINFCTLIKLAHSLGCEDIYIATLLSKIRVDTKQNDTVAIAIFLIHNTLMGYDKTEDELFKLFPLKVQAEMEVGRILDREFKCAITAIQNAQENSVYLGQSTRRLDLSKPHCHNPDECKVCQYVLTKQTVSGRRKMSELSPFFESHIHCSVKRECSVYPKRTIQSEYREYTTWKNIFSQCIKLDHAGKNWIMTVKHQSRVYSKHKNAKSVYKYEGIKVQQVQYGEQFVREERYNSKVETNIKDISKYSTSDKVESRKGSILDRPILRNEMSLQCELLEPIRNMATEYILHDTEVVSQNNLLKESVIRKVLHTVDEQSIPLTHSNGSMNTIRLDSFMSDSEMDGHSQNSSGSSSMCLTEIADITPSYTSQDEDISITIEYGNRGNQKKPDPETTNKNIRGNKNTQYEFYSVKQFREKGLESLDTDNIIKYTAEQALEARKPRVYSQRGINDKLNQCLVHDTINNINKIYPFCDQIQDELMRSTFLTQTSGHEHDIGNQIQKVFVPVYIHYENERVQQKTKAFDHTQPREYGETKTETTSKTDNNEYRLDNQENKGFLDANYDRRSTLQAIANPPENPEAWETRRPHNKPILSPFLNKIDVFQQLLNDQIRIHHQVAISDDTKEQYNPNSCHQS